ncbi:hypothetical protein HC891_08550 [Candidatus Gracilibacteria bacterium]|nr:hypothetical protein [Candidatus Gracilibacteria bacterium]
MSVNGRALAAIQPDERARRYMIAVPPAIAPLGSFDIALQSATFSVPPDPRLLGVRVEGVALRSIGASFAWPPLAQLLAQAGLLGLTTLFLLRLNLPRSVSIGSLIIVATALGAAAWAYPLLALPLFVRLLVAFVLLLALTLALLPWLERALAPWMPADLTRALWAIGLLGCVLRLGGALFPTFAAHDVKLNVDRLLTVINGTLVLTNESFEFGGGMTVYPPGPYLFLMPGLLFNLAPQLLVQGGIAIFDGLCAAMVGGLAYVVRKNTGYRIQDSEGQRAALFAALLYAVVPVPLTSLFYGHTAQVFGQGLMVPLALALLYALQRSQRSSTTAIYHWQSSNLQSPVVGWLAVGSFLTVALLSHIGVTILALAWMGLFWLALLLRRTINCTTWLQLTATLAASAFLGFLFAYSPVVMMHVQQFGQVSERVTGDAILPSYNLIAKAWWISFQPLGLALFIAGMLFAWPRHMPPGGGELMATWFGAALFFCVVELLTGLQVRYLTFLAPPACIFAALFLDKIAAYGRLPRTAAWATVALLLAFGATYWYRGVLGIEALSMVPVLR